MNTKKENLIDLRNNRGNYEGHLEHIWTSQLEIFPLLTRTTLRKTGFSCLLHIKTRHAGSARQHNAKVQCLQRGRSRTTKSQVSSDSVIRNFYLEYNMLSASNCNVII